MEVQNVVDRINMLLVKSKGTPCSGLLKAFSIHYLPAWFSLSFQDDDQIFKGLISFFEKSEKQGMSSAFHTLRRIRNLVQHEKIVNKKLLSELHSSIQYISIESESHPELFSRSIELQNCVEQIMKDFHVSILPLKEKRIVN
jgi:hypothetical protein